MNTLQQKTTHLGLDRRLFTFWLAVLVSLLLALSLPTGAVLAGPVAPGNIHFTQPDGTVITVTPFGDEYYNGYEYLGYTILLDKNSGYWVYAVPGFNGGLQPGDARAGLDAVPADLQRNLRSTPAMQARALASAQSAPTSWSGSQGSGKVLIILVDFTPSTSRGTTAAQWNAKFFDHTPGAKSVKNYYEQASYGKFTMEPVPETYGTVNDGVIEVTLPYANGYPWPGETERTSVKDALLAADPYVDFAALDTDHNGALDNTELHLVLIVRGFEESYGGTGGACTPNVWGHRWSMTTGTCPSCAPVVDGVTVGASAYNGGYTREGEWHEFISDGCTGNAPGHIATMGIMVHELGHDINWPDTYDIDGSSNGVGNWDIMAGGSWGYASGDLYSGETPVLPDPFLKWYQHWLTPVQVTAPSANVAVPNSAQNDTVYQIGVNPNGVDWNFNKNSGTGEYFLVENRQQLGFDAGLRAIGSAAKGCLIYHVDETRTSTNSANADETRKLVDVEEANGTPQNLDFSATGNRGDTGDPWPGSTLKTAFNATSDPNTNWYGGSASGIALANISTAGTGCTIDFTGAGPTWTGSVSSDWNNAANWTTGQVPNQADNVIIPNGVPNWPNVNAAAAVYNLNILNGAHVDATADVSLEVYGNWSEQGSGAFNASAGTVVLRGTSAQMITTGVGSHFYHLQIGDGSTSQTVTAGSDLDVNGNLTIQAGAKLSAGSHTLRVAGNWIDNPFGFDPGTGAVILDGATQTVQRVAAETTVYSNDLTSTTGWSTYDANGGGSWGYSTSTAAPNSPNHGLHARYFPNTTVAADDWLFSPGFTLQAGVTYSIRFNYGAYSASLPEKIAVHIGTAQTVGAMTTQVFDNSNIVNLTWQQGTGAFTPTSSGTYYVGFHAYSVANRGYPAVDDLVVTAPEPDLAFYNLSVANGSTATLADNAAVRNNLAVDAGGALALGTYGVTVDGAVTNNGALAQTKTVNAASVPFLNLKDKTGATDKYWGATIDPGSGNMGSTTVTIRGNQLCPSSSDGVRRCFDLVPTTPQTAVVTFYYTEAERNGAENSTMQVYHWNGAAWELETGATTRGGSGDSQWARAAGIDAYSPFALNSNHTVIFDNNGGTGTMSNQSANVPTALTLNTFTRVGYSFSGWNTASNGSGTAYANGAIYSFAADITLYAQWTANSTHAVTYANGGGTGTLPTQGPVSEGASFTVAAGATLSRAGYTFAGWNDGTNPYAAGSTYTMGASDVTLTAQWTANPAHTVTFNSNGGTGSMSPQSANVPTALTPNTFTHVGYTFAGWNTQADGLGTSYADGVTYDFTADITLYAQWTANPTHTVTYANGGGTGTLPTQSPVSEGASFTVASGAALSRAGYTFAGWNDGTNSYAAGATYTMGTSDVTLTAQWTANSTHTVTYANGGGTGTLPTQSPVSEGASFTVASGATLSRAGYTFAGWNDGTNSYAAGATYTMGTSDVTLTAQWSALPNHTVTFNSNGGTGTMSDQSANVPMALTVNTFTRVGYTFIGWNTNPGGGGTTYADGALYDFSADTTLYAQWTVLPTFTVTFDANGGTGTMTAQTNYIAAALTLNAFTNVDYSFSGWNTAADGSGTSYADGAVYSFGADITLYAQWTALLNHTVTFDANGGADTMTAQTNYTAAALTLNAFTNVGYTFAGWNTQANGLGTSYADGAVYSFSADITLYAQWSALPNHSVTFDSNGGSGTMSNQSANVPTALTANTFTRAGYTFAGWNTAANGSGTNYADGAVYSFSADITLYAQWTANPTHTVTYANGGGTGTLPTQGPVSEGASFTVASGATLSRAGYTFAGWNDGTNPYAAGSTYTMGTSDVTLTAQWTANSPHTVTFNSNGGAGTMSNQGANVPTALTANTFTRVGYSFSSWNTAANGSGITYTNGATYDFSADITLYAQWIANSPHTVTFNNNGGTGTMSDQTANVPMALTLNTFTRAGYTFAGWNTAADGTGTNYADGVTYAFSADITLYAQWTANPTHTVTFNGNGGTGTMSPQTANIPTALTLNTFTRAGYTFAGWNTAANGSGTNYANGATYSFAADVTLYAQWSVIPPTCYALTLSHTGQGSNPVASLTNSTGCSTGRYVAGASINLSGAAPTTGWKISGWSGTNNNASTAGTNSVTMPASALTASVTYTQIDYSLTIAIAGSGSVAKSPNQTTYHYGDIVQLTATPASGWTFTGWSGNLSGAANPASLTIDGNKSVTATFSQIPTSLVYGVHDEGLNNTQLFTLNPQTLVTTALGSLQKGYDIEALSLHPTTGALYATSGANNTHDKRGYLFSVNKQTGALTAIGYTGYKSVPGLSFRKDGTLWGWASDKGLIQINLTTGKGTMKYSSDLSVGDVAWNNSGTTLYIVTTDRRLYGYNPATNKMTLITDDLPSNIEALDMRSDGLLMMGIHGSTWIRAYDPIKKNFVSSQYVRTIYNDVEGIAWP